MNTRFARMAKLLARRSFLTLAGSAFVAPLAIVGRQRGIDVVEQHTGVRPAFGGVHPGRGTQNALLSLGIRRYLEIIAADPQQNASAELANMLKNLKEPRLVGWAAHPGDIQVLAADLAKAGIVAEGPTPGSRK